jgi:hypothetical protein
LAARRGWFGREAPWNSISSQIVQARRGRWGACRRLDEDSRRCFRERDARIELATRRGTNELASISQHTSGASLDALEAVSRQALHDCCDEMSAKRRRYRELRAAEGRVLGLIRRRRGPLRCFSLTEKQRSTLDS